MLMLMLMLMFFVPQDWKYSVYIFVNLIYKIGIDKKHE